MNILQVASGLFNGGVTSHIKSLTRCMINDKNKVVIVSFKIPDDKNDEALKKMGAKIYYLPFNKVKKNPLNSFYIIKELIHIIKKEEIDIIHSHYREPNIFLNIVSSILKVPYVWTYHLTGVKYKGISKLLSFHGNKTIAVSKECEEDLINRFKIPKDNIELIYNGINVKEYIDYDSEKEILKNKYNIDEGKYVISILSRLVEVKGHIEALKAIEILKKKHKDIFLLITGCPECNLSQNQYYNKLSKLIDEKNLHENVKIVGFEDSKDIITISDINILPSYKEGFGIVCLEAMAMGVPVIRTKTAGWNDMSEFCEVIDIKDTKALADKIDLLITNKDRYKELSTNGVKFVNENFDEKIMYKKTLELYNQVVEERS